MVMISDGQQLQDEIEVFTVYKPFIEWIDEFWKIIYKEKDDL